MKTTIKKVSTSEKLKDYQKKLTAYNLLVECYPNNKCFKEVRDSLKKTVNKLKTTKK